MPFVGNKIAVTVNRVDPETVAVKAVNRTGSRRTFVLPDDLGVLNVDGNTEGVHLYPWPPSGREFAVKLDDGSIVAHESSDPEVVSDGQAQQLPEGQPSLS